MHPFDYVRVSTVPEAVKSGSRESAKFVAGGTNLIDLMKCTVERPAHVVDVNALPLASIEAVSGGIRIGALARMSDVAAHPLVQQRFPAVSQALLLSASPQLRNAASIGGNLMQRTRCPYFRELIWTPCNKRNPGSGCSAREGENRMQAVIGTSDACIATHPSDFAVAVAALDGVLTLHGPKGERRVNAVDFHLLPGRTPHLEHDLAHGELITSVFLPDAPHAAHSSYLKVRDRSSYEFALASAAVGLALDGNTIRGARVAFGGIGTKPWRARAAEAVLIGKAATVDVFRAAADVELKDARGYGQNDFKIELAKRTLVRALGDLAGGAA
ncbi:MAG: xanthine dehydrogenase family protein subunit M [Acidobacteria bacterium]|nr:xanthine dehydrogenase family protein subunit M [Acidobacteriota bacterium]MBV9476302.1 xanthine dehydrogenase family protein subunit M [Acidobacteriota bacterium]